MIIERTQKKVIFDEAAQKGIVGSRILEIPEIFQRILGITDVGQQIYGSPLTPIYDAKSGELIQIPKIANFFTGLARDLRVTDTALNELEDTLVMFNLEMWTRMQLLKNRAMNLSKKAKVEKLRTSIGATWIYTESFSTTNFLDMINTTAWLDTSEGIAFLPTSGSNQTIPPQKLTITDQRIPEGSNLLGSSAAQAFDGLDSTNWRCLFINDAFASAIADIDIPTDVTAISIDPIGFGIQVKVETDSGRGWKEIINAIIYNKKTFPVEQKEVQRLRVSFTSATSTLPKTAGIREFIVHSTESVRTAEIVSRLLKPTDSFTEIKIDYKAELPTGAKITTFFRTSSGNAWTQIQPGDWKAITDTDNTSLSVQMTDAVNETTEQNFRGLYGISVGSSNSSPLTTNEGIMNIGVDQVEVSVFKKDWLEEGDIPHRLLPGDFKERDLSKTWCQVPAKGFGNAGSGLVIQYANGSSISSDSELTRGGKYILFQRRLDAESFDSDISQYNQLCVVALAGASSGVMQYGHNYRMKFDVFCPKQFHYNDGRYWLYQGYRVANKRSYRDTGKSYGAFSMYINGILVVGDSVPNTVWDDGTTDATEMGKNFTFTLNEGWNTVELLMNVINPSIYGVDNFDVNDRPYLQLSLYPSFFDPSFRENNDTQITDIVASGQHKPVSEFDLLWNMPKEPIFWAWDYSRKYVLFNVNNTRPIDGYLKGEAPQSTIAYRSIPIEAINDLYVKIVLEREQSSAVSPTLDEYSISVR